MKDEEGVTRDITMNTRIANVADLTVMRPAHAARVLHRSDMHQPIMRSMSAQSTYPIDGVDR